MRLEHAGVVVDLPPGWEARARTQPPSEPGARGNLLLHAATVPLPAQRGDFGSGVVELLGPDDVFVSLFEYDETGRREGAVRRDAACRCRARRTSRPPSCSAPQLGHSGAQWFFTVVGSRRSACTRCSAATAAVRPARRRWRRCWLARPWGGPRDDHGAGPRGAGAR